MPVGGTTLIILHATPGTLCARLLSAPPLVGIGLISYSVYLWHQPLFAFFRLQSRAAPSETAFLLLTLLALGLGWLSWRYIERPFRDRQRLSRAGIFRFSAVAACLLLGLGVTGHAFDGFFSRFPPRERHLAMAADSERMGRYVYTRYRDHRDRPFDRAARLKVMVVGDSFAQDFINMLAETGGLDRVSLSTYEIPSRCGNLYVKTDFSEHIQPDDLAKCVRDGWYDQARTLTSLAQADVIFLASAWSSWVAERLPESIANLQKDFDGRVVVIGRKFFGDVQPARYIGMSDAEKRSLRHSIEGLHAEANEIMRASYGPDTFVDLSRLFCGSATDCPVFTPDLKLISYDGTHLTREGAVYLGRKLLAHPLIRETLGQDGARLAGRSGER